MKIARDQGARHLQKLLQQKERNETGQNQNAKRMNALRDPLEAVRRITGRTSGPSLVLWLPIRLKYKHLKAAREGLPLVLLTANFTPGSTWTYSVVEHAAQCREFGAATPTPLATLQLQEFSEPVKASCSSEEVSKVALQIDPSLKPG